MVGNSISKVCPYIREWDLEKIFKSLKQGEIATKVIENEENNVKIAIEFCQSSGRKNNGDRKCKKHDRQRGLANKPPTPFAKKL